MLAIVFMQHTEVQRLHTKKVSSSTNRSQTLETILHKAMATEPSPPPAMILKSSGYDLRVSPWQETSACTYP